MLVGTRKLRSQRPVFVHAHYTEEVSRSKGREGVNGVGCGNLVGDGNGNRSEIGGGNGNVDADWSRDRKGMGTEMEGNEKTQYENSDGSGYGAGKVKKRRICAIKNK